jgi:seryl-tRNA synthetase
MPGEPEKVEEPAIGRIIGRLEARVALLNELEALTRRRGEATELLGRIEEADRRDEDILRKNSQRHREEIERVSIADRATRAYHGPKTTSAISSGHRTEHTA